MGLCVGFSQWRRQFGLTENDGHENDGPSKLQGMKLQDMKLQDRKLQDMKMPDMKLQDMKMTDKNDGRTRICRRTNRVLTVCKFLNPNTVIHSAYGFIPACAQVGKLSPLYFNL